MLATSIFCLGNLDELWANAREAIIKHTGNFQARVSDMSLIVQERSIILRDLVKEQSAFLYESAREHGTKAYDYGYDFAEQYLGPHFCSAKSYAKEHFGPKVKMCFDHVHEQAVIHLGDERVEEKIVQFSAKPLDARQIL